MDEQLQQKLIEIIGSAESFTVETAPKVAADIILWAQIQGALALMVIAFLTAAVIYLTNLTIQLCRENEEEGACAAAVIAAASAFVAALLCIPVVGAIQATFAPYSYLLEQIR
jgi:hypothetical protein